MTLPEEYRPRAQKIKLFAMDADGTLTDGAMYYSARGEELKRFSTRDGMGITLLHLHNIKTAIITSEQSQTVQARAEKLKISTVLLGVKQKTNAIVQLAESFGLTLDEIAYIGDDVNDSPIMDIVGLSACPSDAHSVILEKAHYICKNSGGNGAVREFSDMILRSQEKSLELPYNW